MMRSSLFLLAIAFLFSCAKDKTTNNPNAGEQYIRFKSNVQNIAHTGDARKQASNGVLASRTIINTSTVQMRQLIVLGITGSTNNTVTLSFRPDSVRSGQTYILGGANTEGFATIVIDGKQHTVHAGQPYSVTVKIVQHSGDWISGTFAGKVGFAKGDGTYEELTITEGSFKSKVAYF